MNIVGAQLHQLLAQLLLEVLVELLLVHNQQHRVRVEGAVEIVHQLAQLSNFFIQSLADAAFDQFHRVTDDAVNAAFAPRQRLAEVVLLDLKVLAARNTAISETKRSNNVIKTRCLQSGHLKRGSDNAFLLSWRLCFAQWRPRAFSCSRGLFPSLRAHPIKRSLGLDCVLVDPLHHLLQLAREVSTTVRVGGELGLGGGVGQNRLEMLFELSELDATALPARGQVHGCGEAEKGALSPL